MTGFFGCTGHLLLFEWVMFVFILWHHLYHGSLHLVWIWMVLILQKPVIPSLFHLV
jgi:hypothetical protein